MIFKIFLSSGEENLFSFVKSAAILLVIAGIADMADGAVARLLKGESEFGGQFDSLSDAVTFGVAPPLLVLRSLPTEAISPALQVVLTTSAMVYTLCGVLRLVRYNVTSRESRLKETFQHKRTYFRGLPIPAGAALIVSAALFMISPLFNQWLPLTVQSRAAIMIFVMVLSGYFMVSRWPFPSVKAFHLKVPSFYLILAVGIFGVLFLYGLLDHFSTGFFLASWLYLLTSFVFALFKKRSLLEPVEKAEE